jgi:hypothetical protein
VDTKGLAGIGQGIVIFTLPIKQVGYVDVNLLCLRA